MFSCSPPVAIALCWGLVVAQASPLAAKPAGSPKRHTLPIGRRLDHLQKDLVRKTAQQNAQSLAELNSQRADIGALIATNTRIIVDVEDLKTKISFLRNATSAIRKDVQALNGKAHAAGRTTPTSLLEVAEEDGSDDDFLLQANAAPAQDAATPVEFQRAQRTDNPVLLQTSQKEGVAAPALLQLAPRKAVATEQQRLNEARSKLTKLKHMQTAFHGELDRGEWSRRTLASEQAQLNTSKHKLTQLHTQVTRQLKNAIVLRNALRSPLLK